MDDKQKMIEEKELIIFLQNHWWDGHIDAIAHSLIAAGLGDVKEKDKRIAVLERALENTVRKMFYPQIGSMTYDSFESCVGAYLQNARQQAEQELAEEKK